MSSARWQNEPLRATRKALFSIPRECSYLLLPMDKRDDQNAIPAAMAADAGGAGGWRVLLLAGQRPGVDPLAGHFGQELKALVPLAGRPMLARCLANLLAVPGVRAVTVLAQSPERPRPDPAVARAAAHAPVSIHPSDAGLATSSAEPAAPA